MIAFLVGREGSCSVIPSMIYRYLWAKQNIRFRTIVICEIDID